MEEEINSWVNLCFENPQKGINHFLKSLCEVSGAKYAHIRAKSRLGKFYNIVDSIGPYKNLCWKRRFHLIDGYEMCRIAYSFLDYENTNDCIQLKNKYDQGTKKEYFESIKFGFYIPLFWQNIEYGYVILSWIDDAPNKQTQALLRRYMDIANMYIPLLYSACRSIITDRVFKDLWDAFKIIHEAPTEVICYHKITSACQKLWGYDSTAYIGKVNLEDDCIEVISITGCRAGEIKQDNSKIIIPLNDGIYNLAMSSSRPIISNSLMGDTRFVHKSIFTGDLDSSAISVRIGSLDENPIALLTVEHKIENYFDLDDIRYIDGIATNGYHALLRHTNWSLSIGREIDTLITEMAHDVAEPLQSLIADADVLKYQISAIKARNHFRINQAQYWEILQRSSNIIETGIQINQQIRKHLDVGIDGATSTVVDGRINLYRLLNSLVAVWEERAANQGIEIRCLFDAFRGIHVQCDENEFKSSLIHLIGNAIKYSYWGRRQDSDSKVKYNRYVGIVGRISVGIAIIEFHNLGIGILPSEISKVKEKFYRGELAKKEGRAGTGRGLWSATQFFEGIGGNIEIESENLGDKKDMYAGPYKTIVKAMLPYQKVED